MLAIRIILIAACLYLAIKIILMMLSMNNFEATIMRETLIEKGYNPKFIKTKRFSNKICILIGLESAIIFELKKKTFEMHGFVNDNTPECEKEFLTKFCTRLAKEVEILKAKKPSRNDFNARVMAVATHMILEYKRTDKRTSTAFPRF